MRILAIETSCDETAAAVIVDGRQIASNVVATQIELHRRFGGVFPEVASRQHVLSIQPVIEEALQAAGVDHINAVDAIIGIFSCCAFDWANCFPYNWKFIIFNIYTVTYRCDYAYHTCHFFFIFESIRVRSFFINII